MYSLYNINKSEEKKSANYLKYEAPTLHNLERYSII